MRSSLLLAALLGGTALLAASSAVSGPAGTNPVDPAPVEGSYKVDPVHSGILFRIDHMGVGAFWGRFNQVEGSFELAQKAADCSVEITIAAESVDTNSEGRDKHVKGPDFFNTAEFPEITFRSTRVKKKGEGFEVTGTMTLRGKEGEVTLLLTKVGEAETRMGTRAGFEGEFRFSRSAFGVDGVKDALGDEIRTIVFIEGIKG